MVGFLVTSKPSSDGFVFLAVVNDGLSVINKMTESEMEAFRASIDRIKYVEARDIPGLQIEDDCDVVLNFTHAAFSRINEYPGIKAGNFTVADGDFDGDSVYEVAVWLHRCPYTGETWWCERMRHVSGTCW